MLIEHLQGIRNASYFGLFSFAEGLVKWNVSGSKALHSLDSCSRACGSVATMKNFFKEKGAVPNSCVMAEDIEIFADNTKRKGRTSRVKEDVKTPIGIATNVVIIQFNFESFIQQDIRLSPENWLYNTDLDETVCDEIKELEDELNEKELCRYRYDYQNKLLKEILSELSFNGNGVPCDNLYMLLVLDKDGYLVCPKCCAAMDQSSRFCEACQYGLCNFPSTGKLYNDVPSGHPEAKPIVILVEVIDCNLCSYKAIIKVLENLPKQAKVGELQKWVLVGFDSVPYRMALE